jgi:hypothetical protein
MHKKRRALISELQTPAFLRGGLPSGVARKKLLVTFAIVSVVWVVCAVVCMWFLCVCACVCPTAHPRVQLLYRLMGLREGENDEDHGVEVVSFIMHLVS